MPTTEIQHLSLLAVRHRAIVVLLVILFAVDCCSNLLSAPALADAAKANSVAQEEEFGEQTEMSKSSKIYRSGDLIFKPHPQEKGTSLEDFEVCRGERTILRESISSTPANEWLWIGFAFSEETRTKPVHSFDGKLSDFISKDAKPGSNPFVDLNGDGVPDLIVATSTGGMHCCSTYTVNSLGDVPRRVGQIHGDDGSVIFADIDKDGVYEAIANDFTFAYWKTSFAESPAPMVILKPTRTGYQLAANVMKTTPPSKERQERLLARWIEVCSSERSSSGNKDFRLAPSVWGDMLDLIYSGNSELAFRLLDDFWTNDAHATNLETLGHSCEIVYTSKEKFQKMFLEQLSHSPYLAGIKRLNPADERIRTLRMGYRRGW